MRTSELVCVFLSQTERLTVHGHGVDLVDHLVSARQRDAELELELEAGPGLEHGLGAQLLVDLGRARGGEHTAGAREPLVPLRGRRRVRIPRPEQLAHELQLGQHQLRAAHAAQLQLAAGARLELAVVSPSPRLVSPPRALLPVIRVLCLAPRRDYFRFRLFPIHALLVATHSQLQCDARGSL